MQMTDEEFKSLDLLREAAWRSFDARRAYEWKLSFGLWTALALTAGALISREPAKVLHANWSALVCTIAGAAVVVVVHMWWTHNCRLRNDRDRRLSYLFEERMCAGVGVDWEEVLKIFPVALARQQRSDESLRFTLRNYWHFSHIAITFVLAVATILAMLASIMAPDASASKP